MCKVSTRLAAIAIIFLSPFATSLKAEIFFEVIDPDEGSSQTEVRGISGDGKVVVGRTSEGAFRWTREHGFDVFSPNASRAWDASFDGTVIVGRSTSGSAYRWTATDGVTELDELPNSRRSIAYAVSDDGKVVAGRSTNSEGESQAVRWLDGDVLDLGTLGDDRPEAFTEAYGVSADGSTVVGVSNHRAFRWTLDTGMQSLGTLGESSGALTASSDGNHIIGHTQAPGFTSVQGFLWTEALGMEGLGERSPGSYFWREAHDVSADGSVVVGQQNGEGDLGGAFIWTRDGGLRLLDDVLRQDYGLGEAIGGLKLNSAVAISNDGQTIVGTSGKLGWIVSIPEPKSFHSFVFGLTLAFAWRRVSSVSTEN